MPSDNRSSFINALPDAYLICRDRSIGHDWDVDVPFQLSRKLRSGHELIRVSRCARCGMVRHEIFDHNGPRGYVTKKSARYKQPPGYSETGIGKVTNADVWLEQLRRVKPLPPVREKKLRAVPVAS
jgi:hypothetical protein